MARFEIIKSVICDDVRVELGGKFILIGVYPGDTIAIASLQAPFSFSAYIEVKGDTPGIHEGSYEIVSPLGQIKTQGPVKLGVIPEATHGIFFHLLQVQPDAFGDYHVNWRVGTGPLQHVTTLHVVQAGPPPSP